VPIVKRSIAGQEYSFAPLKLKHLKAINKARQDRTVFERIDEWAPMIQDSMQRAGSEMPDVEDMDIEQAGEVFAELIKAVMNASGYDVEVKGQGGAQPVAA
jgi:hypothetical protein